MPIGVRTQPSEERRLQAVVFTALQLPRPVTQCWKVTGSQWQPSSSRFMDPATNVVVGNRIATMACGIQRCEVELRATSSGVENSSVL